MHKLSERCDNFDDLLGIYKASQFESQVKNGQEVEAFMNFHGSMPKSGPKWLPWYSKGTGPQI